MGNTNSNVPIHPEDYAALKALAESSSIDLLYKEIWDFSNPTVDAAVVNEWEGVTVDTTTGRVTKLYLTGAPFNKSWVLMEASIPSELGNLSALQELDLSYNFLEGTIPPELGNLGALQKLVLRDNYLEGTIPPELSNLSALQTLDLSLNDLKGTIPPELGNLSALQTLDLAVNDLKGTIPPELGNLSVLQELDLAANDLNGTIPPELGNLSALQGLRLSDNKLRGKIPSEMLNLSNLEWLDMYNKKLKFLHIGSEDDDTYQLKAKNSAGNYIQDFGGNDTLELMDVELSLSSPTSDQIGLMRDDTDLAIDINADGKASAVDLRIEDFFQDTRVSQAGKGFIETVDNLSGSDILASSGEVQKGTRKNDFLKGSDRGDLLLGRWGHDLLVGGDGNDTLIGNVGNDKLKGDVGNDILTGSAGRDRFIFQSKKEFDEANLGQDVITDFLPGKDWILLDKTVFASLESDRGRGFSIIAEFGTVDSDEAAATSDAYIVYNSNNGNLFYNANGDGADFGTGGQFATLEGAPELDANDFIIQR